MRSIAPRALCASLIALAIAVTLPAAAATAGPVEAARHHGEIAGDTIRWTSSYRLRQDEPQQIPLAYPLPAGATLEHSPDVAPVLGADRIVALTVRAPYSAGRIVVVTVAEKLDRRGGDARLAPPLAAGDVVQIVDVAGGDDLRFEPDARAQLARHVGFFAPADLPPSARDACDHAVGYRRARATDDPVYLVPSATIVAAEGIRGALVSAADRRRTGALGAGAAFVAVIVGLVLLQRRLARAAREEQAERALADAFAELDGKAEKRT